MKFLWNSPVGNVISSVAASGVLDFAWGWSFVAWILGDFSLSFGVSVSG